MAAVGATLLALPQLKYAIGFGCLAFGVSRELAVWRVSQMREVGKGQDDGEATISKADVETRRQAVRDYGICPACGACAFRKLLRVPGVDHLPFITAWCIICVLEQPWRRVPFRVKDVDEGRASSSSLFGGRNPVARVKGEPPPSRSEERRH